MSRAALMTCVDPFVGLLGYYFYNRNFKNEIDRLYIICNNRWPELSKVLGDRVEADPRVVYRYFDREIGLEAVYKTFLEISNEPYLLFLEDDGYILKRGVVDFYFRGLEDGKYEVVGSPRPSCTPGLWEAGMRKFNLVREGGRDIGPNFWPNFFWIRRDLIEKTDQHFANKMFPAGERIDILDYIPEEDQIGDTFVWFSLQVRALTTRILEIPQVKAFPTWDDLSFYETEVGHKLDYIHAGSLSSGLECFFDHNSIARHQGAAKEEMEQRIAFWTIAANFELYDDVAEWKTKYLEGMEKMIDDLQLDRDRIKHKVDMFSKLLVWR